MTGTRLVPPEGAEFPYDLAKQALAGMPGMVFEELDIPAIVAAGQRSGWPQSAIDHHWALMKRGKCFSFHQNDAPELSGTLYEDNVFFHYFSGQHEDSCWPKIERLAKRLGLELIQC